MYSHVPENRGEGRKREKKNQPTNLSLFFLLFPCGAMDLKVGS
jgi:hypothetical protein